MRLFSTIVLALVIISVQGQNFDWVEQNSNTSMWLNDICFVDDLTGWAVGDNGTIVATVDGGETWTPQVSKTFEQLRSVFFLSKTRGWAVGGTTRLTLLNTYDGGSTWEALLNNISGETYLSEIEFHDGIHGFAISPDAVYYTSDGGAHWDKGINHSSIASGLSLGDLHVLSDTSAFLCGKYTTSEGSEKPGVFENISSSEGLWMPQDDPEFDSDDELVTIYFTDNMKGFTGGKNGKIYTMEAEGTNFPGTWQLNFNPENAWISTLDFSDENHGMFLAFNEGSGTANALIYHTYNGGTSWSSSPDQITGLDLATLTTPGAGLAWIAGSKGQIYKGTSRYPVSVNEESTLAFSVMPNPFLSNLVIKSPEAYKKVQINIFNYTGQLVESVLIGDFQYSCEIEGLDHLASGVYFLNMKSADGHLKSTHKIVKN